MMKREIVRMEKKLQKWADLFKVIGHPIRLATVFILYGSDVLRGKGSLRFNEIQTILGLNSEKNLTYHLDQLRKVGLITKNAHKDEKGRVYPLYHMTEKGEEFLSDFDLIEPLRKQILKSS